MFSTREVPWMKLGQLAETPKTAVEAMDMAGLNFTVAKQPAAYQDVNGEWQVSDNRVAVVREDINEFYEFVGKDYELYQYSEAFEFMDAINPHYVAAGALKGGKQAFLIVQPENSTVTPGGDDKHDMFVILRASHDRSRAVEVSLMPLRQKCMNQLALGSMTRGAEFRRAVPHSRNMRDKLIQAQHIMAQLDDYTAEFKKLAEHLMRSQPNENEAREILKKHVNPRAKKQEEVLDSILYMWHENEEVVGYNDTAWGLVNAVSEHYDWRRNLGTPESRFTGALQGQTFNALSRITRELVALAA